ncbi:MAG: hypothetical protein ABIO65_06475 [Nitrospiria bacterium]
MTRSTALRMVLDTYAQQRLLFEDALQEEIRTLRDDRTMPPTEARSSFAVNVLGQGSSQDEILAYCERGEELSIQEYLRVGDANLPPRVRRLIEYQLGRMAAAKARFRALRGLETGTDEESDLIRRRNGDMDMPRHDMPPGREACGQLLHV